jgi:hypothetical protein
MTVSLPWDVITAVADYLEDSSDTLRACSLVATSWTAPFQELYFQVVNVGSPTQWSQLVELLVGRPHIRPYIHKLVLPIHKIEPGANKIMGQMPSDIPRPDLFTNMTHLLIRDTPFNSEIAPDFLFNFERLTDLEIAAWGKEIMFRDLTAPAMANLTLKRLSIVPYTHTQLTFLNRLSLSGSGSTLREAILAFEEYTGDAPLDHALKSLSSFRQLSKLTLDFGVRIPSFIQAKGE